MKTSTWKEAFVLQGHAFCLRPKFELNRALYVNISCVLTLLTKRSVWSKCRPYIFGASPGGDSIFTHTSIPLRASVSGLWLASIPVTTPISKNYKTKTYLINPEVRKNFAWLSPLATENLTGPNLERGGEGRSPKLCSNTIVQNLIFLSSSFQFSFPLTLTSLIKRFMSGKGTVLIQRRSKVAACFGFAILFCSLVP